MKDERGIDPALVRRTETCSDCIDRDDVDLLGRPRPMRRGRIRECEGCRGTGRVPRERYIDPWQVWRHDA